MTMNILKNGTKEASKNSKPTLFTRLVAASAVSSTVLLMSAFTHADANQTTLPIDLAGTNTTKHEIAVLQVLSEICPPMLDSSQQNGFYKTYNRELKQLLPTISDPKAAINYLSTQQDYKMILTSMRNWTMGYSHEDNLALCTDLAVAKY